MVKPSPQVDRDRSLQGQSRCQDRAARRQDEGVHQLPGVRDLVAHHLYGREGAGLQLVHVRGHVHQQQVVLGGTFRLHQIRGFDDLLGQQPLLHQSVFDRGKDMISQLEEVSVGIDDLHRCLRSHLWNYTCRIIMGAEVEDRTRGTGKRSRG